MFPSYVEFNKVDILIVMKCHLDSYLFAVSYFYFILVVQLKVKTWYYIIACAMDVYISKHLPVQSQKWKHKKKLRNIFRINNKRHQNNFIDFSEQLHSGVFIANFEMLWPNVIHFFFVFLWLWIGKYLLWIDYIF